MNQRHSRTKSPRRETLAALLLTIATAASTLDAAVLYDQDFEGETLGTIGFNTVGLAHPFNREIESSGGVTGSAGLVYTFDGSQAGQAFATSFIRVVNATHGADASRLRFSADIKAVGNTSATPVRLRVYQIDANYEATRGIDANNDGDMTDGADIFISRYTPALVDGGEFVTASFLLDQGALEANVYPSTPILPVLDPALPLRWSISFGSDGFGFDAGNSVAFDNIRIELIPEPTSAGLAIGFFIAIAAWRRVECA